MPNLNCQPAIDTTTHSAVVRGTADQIPANHFLRIAYGVTSGGPYNTFTAPVPGDTTFGQQYSATITSLLPEQTYYYVLEELDTDGITILGQSGQCQFRTRAFSTTCEVIGFTETSITVQVCADYVAPEQTLDFIWGTTQGGPYPNNGGSVPGDDTLRQCAQFTLEGLDPCTVIYYRGSVTNVPAIYEVDWQYAHRNRTAVAETAQLRIGPEADYPANQTLVDTHVAGPGPSAWTVRNGTYPVPLNIATLHMGFVATSPPGSVGNFLDSCSIVLRRVLPSPLVIGEQLINPGFEAPVQPGGVSFVPNGTPGMAWETTDPANVIEYWRLPNPGNHPPHSGGQFVELNAFNAAELFQVVDLAVATADSQECIASTFNLDCNLATDVECVSATFNGDYCGLPGNYSYQFQYATALGGPFTEAGPVVFADGYSTVDIPVSAGSGPLQPNTTYFYRIAALDDQQDIIGVSETCSFTTLDCVQWCGGWHSPDDCVLVDPENGDPPYFNCNP